MTHLSVKWRQGKRFLKYYFRARTKYQVHSPAVYAFIENVLEDSRQYYCFQMLAVLRKKLLRETTTIQVTDYGAGSKVNQAKVRTVGDITRHSASPRKRGEFLFRLAKHYRPDSILELGTSFGLSTLYLSLAAPGAKLITIEGCPQTAELAKINFRYFSDQRIELLPLPFRTGLPQALSQFDTIDLLFIDGDHHPERTEEYIDRCLPHRRQESIFLIADIHWSNGMYRAWERIRQRPEVRCSVELFDLGILFFGKEMREVQHYTLCPFRWKPWLQGFQPAEGQLVQENNR